MKLRTFLLSIALASGCVAETPRTQLLVAVAADPAITPKLVALRVELSSAEQTTAPQQRVQTFALQERALPLSFGIVRGREELLRLAVKGCATPECADPVVEHKLLVRFQEGRTVQVDVALTSACEGRADDCSGPGQTCAPTRGDCQAVLLAPTTVIAPGHEIIPTLEAPHPGLDPSLDAGPEPVPDTGPGPVPDTGLGPMPDTGPAPVADAGPVPNACPMDNVCSPDVYPCVPDDIDGYVCRGQLADWPMPDSVEGARVPPRYTSSAEVVRDEVTGLSWQRQLGNRYAGCTGRVNAAGDRCTFTEARAYCAQLVLEGTGWRLPTKIELESLLDLRPDRRGLDGELFLATPTDFFWTTSPVPFEKLEPSAYVVDFLEGRTAALAQTQPHLVRCVRSSDTPPRGGDRYVPLPQDRKVSDTRTMLTWSNLPYCEKALTYELASEFCSTLRTDTWRLPSLKELLTLVDPTRFAPASPKEFTGLPAAGWVWSSTPGRLGDGHRLVDMTYGYALTQADVTMLLKDPEEAARNSFCVRCVK